ncbi:hypothetical protein [Serratia aquatilis]|uniref:Uncharacterized protein n=1 Tax=Serratia aquatilis TaxID=1737515 RepID=A0ABV6EHH4_9GAMM
MRFYLEDGYPRLDVEQEKQLVSEFLQFDVQSGEYNINLFLNSCKKVASKEIAEWDGTGNAFTITIKADSVTIENAYTYDELHLSSIAEFEWYLKQWERLITTGEEFTIESPFK